MLFCCQQYFSKTKKLVTRKNYQNCLHFEFKENMTKTQEILGKIIFYRSC